MDRPENFSSLPDAISESLLLDDPNDRRLIANCHPPDHVNPEISGTNERYDLVAIGAGAAGLVSAGGTGMLGGRVALIERSLLGGDCLNTGCVPSKAIIRAARAVYDARLARQFSHADQPTPSIDFGLVMERMRSLRARISANDSVAKFREKYGVDVYLGDARFTGPDSIEVDGRRIRFRRAVIATGGRPFIPSIPGLSREGIRTSENIFNIQELPAKLIVIGGGAAGCELAQAFRRFGSEVTILNRGEHLLPREDPEIAAILEEQFRREGINIFHRVTIHRVESERNVIFTSQAIGGETRVGPGLILVATGRIPNIEGLGLDEAGVRDDESGVIVDDHLRTSNPRIYAAGDVCSNLKFTHVADAMARIVIRNAMFAGRERMSQLVIPHCTYTDPEIAQVGWSKSAAIAAGLRFETISAPFHDNDRAILDGEEEGIASIIYEPRSGRILGATIVARHAGEMISELTLAITHRMKLGALAKTIHPYPTQAESLRRIGETYQMSRLTPGRRAWLRRWLAWTR